MPRDKKQTEGVRDRNERRQAAARELRRSTPVEVTDPLNPAPLRHIIAPLLPPESLFDVEGRIVQTDIAELGKPDEILATLAKASVELTSQKQSETSSKESSEAKPKKDK